MLPRGNRIQVFLLIPFRNRKCGYYSLTQLFSALNAYENLLGSLLQMKIQGPTPEDSDTRWFIDLTLRTPSRSSSREEDPFIRVLSSVIFISHFLTKDNFKSLHLSSKSYQIFLKLVTILLTCILLESSVTFISHVSIWIRNIYRVGTVKKYSGCEVER